MNRMRLLMSDSRSASFLLFMAPVLSVVCLASSAWADIKSGEKAYQRGDYTTALREWQPLAKQGQADAQYYIGLLHANGQGVPKGYTEVLHWTEIAAVKGIGED